MRRRRLLCVVALALLPILLICHRALASSVRESIYFAARQAWRVTGWKPAFSAAVRASGTSPTTADVLLAVGPPLCRGGGCYPHFADHDWLYEVNTIADDAHIAIVGFDSSGNLATIDFVAE